MRNRKKQAEQSGKAVSILLILLLVSCVLLTAARWILPRTPNGGDIHMKRAAATQIDVLAKVLDTFFLDTGRYPTEDEGLEALVEDPGLFGWNGPYLRKARLPKDPWGNQYLYRLMPDNTYIVGSAGKDKVMGNNDDIRQRSLDAERKSAMDKNSRSFSTIGLLVTAGGKM